MTLLAQITEFDFCDAEAVFEELEKRDVGGVYSIAISNFHEHLLEFGYVPEPEIPEIWSGRHFHCYVGETYSLKVRLRDHLLGENGDIGFRQSASLVLGLSGSALTQFLIQNSIIAHRYFPFMGDVEERLIQATACPLNLRGKGKSPFARKMRSARREMEASA